MKAAPTAARGAADALVDLYGRCRVERLANGLTVGLLENPQAPLVTTTLWYRAGTRDEPPGQGGVAHFLEHMMFKGSRRFGPGEIDRLTQSLGGVDNAFTSHDATSYYFTFSRDRWQAALDIELDRMTALTLDPAEIERERRVILEEISMYEDDPWDALELATYRAAYGDHPYGRPVLGERDSVSRIGRAELAEFHRRFYRPGNACLVVAGDLGASAFERIVERFADVADPMSGGTRSALPVGAEPGAGSGLGPERVVRHRGETARLLVALPAPPGDHPDYAPLWLALHVLAGGRASRLYRELVDEGRLCASVSADATEMAGPGLCLIAAEPLEGAEVERIERRIAREIAGLAEPAAAEELERARRLLLADWVFALERIHQQALLAGAAMTLFDLDHPSSFLRRVESATAEEVARVAARYLRLEAPAVIAWSLPAS